MRPKRQNKTGIVVILALSLLFSCTQPTIYQSFISFRHIQWPKDQAAVFHIPNADSTSCYNLLVDLRLYRPFNQKELKLMLQTLSANQDSTIYKTINLDLSRHDLSKSSGTWVDYRFAVDTNLRFPCSGPCKLEILQCSPDSLLQNIGGLGISLQKH